MVVYGCTGFTGKLVGEYLAAHYGSEVTWAIAGRNQKKLDAAKVCSCTHNHTWGAQTPKPQQAQQAQQCAPLERSTIAHTHNPSFMCRHALRAWVLPT